MATRNCSVMLVVVAATLAGCTASRGRPSAPGAGSRGGPGSPAAVEAPRPIAPVGRIEEAPIGVAPARPVPSAETPQPPPATRAAVEPTPPAVTSMEPGPVVSEIGPTTPPNVAAALQLIEEGRRLQERGGRNQAREQFERAVAIDPANAYGYFFLARVHYFNRNYDQAIAFASRAVALGARLDPTWLGRVYALQGAVFEEAGRYPDARAAYRRAVTTDPHNLAAQVGLGRVTGGEAVAPAP